MKATFDRMITLNLTADMLAEMDDAVATLTDTNVSTRSEFIRTAIRYALCSLEDDHLLPDSSISRTR